MKKYLVRNLILNKPLLEGHSSILNHLLLCRGIKSTDEATRFINPDYQKQLHDPFLMKDMDKAITKIFEIMEQNKKIAIYSDYDADGIPGAVILYDFFKKLGYENFINYIPDRHDEGFGLNTNAIQSLKDQDVKLIITIDCGIADILEISLANNLGMSVIVTDHHEPKDSLPDAFAIIDPKQPSCMYPDKNLCGSGVIFKLIQAMISKKKNNILEGWEKWLLDMVGIATLSDMVPLRGENRVLSTFGLMVLRKTRRKGLLHLFRKMRLSQNSLSEDDVGFSISPRINAASRMGIARDAFRLFTTHSDTEADELANKLDHINNERKGVVASMIKEAKRIYSSRYSPSHRGVIVLGNPNWRPSLVGLVANSLAEIYGNPFFIWGRDSQQEIKGSCRGGNISLVEIMQNCKDNTFVKYGGHKKSGGFTVSREAIHDLEDRLNQSYENINKTQEPISQTIIDISVHVDEINSKLFDDIYLLSPFGIENEKPLFLINGCKIQNVKTFGKEKNHLEIISSGNRNKTFRAISFFCDTNSFTRVPKEGEIFGLVGSLEKSVFNNRSEMRMRLEDVVSKEDYDMMVQ